MLCYHAVGIQLRCITLLMAPGRMKLFFEDLFLLFFILFYQVHQLGGTEFACAFPYIVWISFYTFT